MAQKAFQTGTIRRQDSHPGLTIGTRTRVDFSALRNLPPEEKEIIRRRSSAPIPRVFKESLELKESLKEVVKEGYLYKRGAKGLIATWRRRYFRMYGPTRKIRYFAAVKEGLTEVSKGTGVIDLSQCTEVKSNNKTDHSFELLQPSRQWHLKAETEEDMTDWIGKIQGLLERPDNKTNQMQHKTLESERKYLSCLLFLVTAYLNPLKERGQTEICEELFGNLEEIIDITTRNETKMETLLTSSLGFETYIDLLGTSLVPVYEKYMQHCLKVSLIRLAELQRDEDFGKWTSNTLKEYSDLCGKTLHELIVMPVLKFPKYLLLSKELELMAKRREKGRKSKKWKEKNCFLLDSFYDLPQEHKQLVLDACLDLDKINLDVLATILRSITKVRYSTKNIQKKLKDMEGLAESKDIRPSLSLASRDTILKDDNMETLFKNTEFTGKGGFGQVVIADMQKPVKRQVAIKKVQCTTSKDLSTVTREIAFLHHSQHPNVVQYIESFRVREEMWILLEPLEGGTLSKAVKVHHLTESLMAFILREVLSALEFVHYRGIAHRDIKSQNVMMTRDGRIKLIDFGLCADITQGKLQSLSGTSGWMAPELFWRIPQGVEVDIWGVGMLLVNMCSSGKEPKNMKCLKNLYPLVMGSCKPNLSEKIPRSSTLQDFSDKCLVIDPKHRATASNLLNHQFIKLAATRDELQEVVMRIFLSDQLGNLSF